MSKTYYYEHPNIDHKIVITIKDNAITKLIFSSDTNENLPKLKIKKLIQNLNQYFESGCELDYPFVMNGTPFQLEVWSEILKIPKGSTKTYKAVAEAIGRPTACRAVANACGANHVALYIPCHRVVGTNSMGGYAFGVGLKSKLLDIENS
jgi:O-6-methylguanine DNA methyltransferase